MIDTDVSINLNCIGWDDEKGRRIREYVSCSVDSYLSGLYELNELFDVYSKYVDEIEKVLSIEIKTNYI